MGMTIKEAIPILHDMYNYYNDTDLDDTYVGFDKEDNNAIEIALDTMKKYQKIEKIINAPIGGTSAKYNAIVNLIKYSEVNDEILSNEWIPMLVSWKTPSFVERETKIFCKDERTYNALIGLLQQDGVKYYAQRVYTISEVDNGNDD